MEPTQKIEGFKRSTQASSSEVPSLASRDGAGPGGRRRRGRLWWAITLWAQEIRIFTPSRILPCMSDPYNPAQKDMRAQTYIKISAGLHFFASKWPSKSLQHTLYCDKSPGILVAPKQIPTGQRKKRLSILSGEEQKLQDGSPDHIVFGKNSFILHKPQGCFQLGRFRWHTANMSLLAAYNCVQQMELPNNQNHPNHSSRDREQWHHVRTSVWRSFHFYT